MKYFLTTIAAFLLLAQSPVWASSPAQDISAALFSKQLPAYLVALKCPGSASLQLQDASEWRQQGDTPFDDVFFTDVNFSTVRSHGERITRLGSFFAFVENPSSPLAKVDMASDGHIDGQALGIPAEINGCSAIPFALNIQDQGTTHDFIVDKTVFDRLSNGDQYAARLLLKGLQKNLIRTLLDTRQPAPAFSVQEKLMKDRGIPLMFFRHAEFLLDDSLTLDEKGNPIQAHALNLSATHSSDFGIDNVYYDADGSLRHVSGAFPVNVGSFALNLAGDAAYADPKGVNCGYEDATYRPNGSLALCDNNYFTLGGGSQKTQSSLVGQENQIFQRSDLAYDNDPLPGVVGLAEYSSNANKTPVTFQVQGLSEKLKSLTLIDNDPHCASGVKFSNMPGAKKTINLVITIPHGCVALAKLVWVHGH